MPQQTTEEANREQTRVFRRVLASAISELRSQEVREAFSSLSIEELVDQQIDFLAEGTDPVRPPRLKRIQKLRQELTDAIAAVRATPPENFRQADVTEDVNTPVEDE